MASASYGIEIGAESVRAVQLKRKAKQWVITDVCEVSRMNESGEERLLGQSLAELITTLPPKGSVTIADTHHSLMVRFFSSVPLPADRLRRLQRLEMLQHADESGDLAMDARVLPLAGDELVSCCILAPPEQVRETLAIADTAGVKNPYITVSSAAMAELMPEFDPDLPDDALEESESAVSEASTVDQVLLDIGAGGTRVVLIRDGHFLGCRHLGMGGQDFTKALMSAEEKTWKQAEEEKINWQPEAVGVQIARHIAQQEQATPAKDDLFLDDDDLNLDDGPGEASTAPTDESESLADFTLDAGDKNSAASDRLELDDELPEKAEKEAAPSENTFSVDSLFTEDEATDEELDLALDDEKPKPAATSVLDFSASDDMVVVHDDRADENGGSSDGDHADAEANKFSDDFVDSVLATPDPEEVRPRPKAETLAMEAEITKPGAVTMAVGFEELGAVFQPIAERLFAQITGSLDYLRKQLHLTHLNVQQVQVTGGGSRLFGLRNYLERRFTRPVVFAQLHQQFSTSSIAFDPRYDGALAVAWSFVSGKEVYDLRPESLQRKLTWRRELIWPRVAAGCVLASSVFFIGADWRDDAKHEADLKAYRAYQTEYNQLKKTI